MSQPPDWVQSLVSEVAQRYVAVDVLAPLACHCCEADGTWEVTLFVSQTEIQGGPQDGALRPSRFHLDLNGFFEIFDSIDAAYWQARKMSRGDEIGAHLGIEGVYQGRRVWLRLPAVAPKRFPPGRTAVFRQRTWDELW